MSVTYRPRNDLVLSRVVDTGEQRGILMPQQSIQGKRYLVEAIGPKVEDLQVGDWVFMTGQQKVDWDMLPFSNDLLTIRQENIILVVEDSDSERFASKVGCDS